MAFKNGLSERLDELRFTSPRSPPADSHLPNYTPLSPGQSNMMSAFQRPPTDVRANLQRRFTTDASTWNFLNQPSTQLPDSGPLDLLSSVSLFFLFIFTASAHLPRTSTAVVVSHPRRG
jgi:hypothetical protein